MKEILAKKKMKEKLAENERNDTIIDIKEREVA